MPLRWAALGWLGGPLARTFFTPKLVPNKRLDG
jgi:hypothetical protein